MKQQASTAITDAISRVCNFNMSASTIVVVCALLVKKERLFGATPPHSSSLAELEIGTNYPKGSWTGTMLHSVFFTWAGVDARIN
ncbi:hypothetical protein BDZ45DRAFT_24515 [Acephala macrosclerotiorum]|nr:hypothetical protein BDZ45DRAFT_24515 [Acephala macrosclerotiorum]